MKRTLASVAAAGLLTFGLAACGDDAETEDPTDEAPAATEEAPAEEETSEPGAPGDGADTTAPGAPEDDAETEAPGMPGDGAQTSAPGMPGDGGETGAAPDPETQEFCDAAMQFLSFGSGAESDPQQALDALGSVEAPEEVQGDVDTIINELGDLSPEELQGSEVPEGVDIEALNTAAENFGVFVGENCTSAM